MNKSFLLIGLAMLGAMPCFVVTQEQKVDDKTKVKFMQRKLDYTKEIVAGLAMEDFNRITKGSQDLMLLSNESAWNAVNSPEYLKASSDFRETVSRLRSASKEKNLDGATLAYIEVTLNCVRCHKQLRSPSVNQKFKPVRSK